MQRGFAIVAVFALTLGTTSAGTQARSAAVASAPVTVPGAPNCPIFPANNVWNMDISSQPVAANSAAMISSIGPTTNLHADFGSYLGYGIPFNVVSGSQAKQAVSFSYADESDLGPYPIPTSPQIEQGSDAHMLIVDRDNCYLYELYAASQGSSGAWSAGSGAIWNLNSNALRPDTWTSADAAGLPILPGLVRFDEAAQGVISHAFRFTAVHTRNMHIYPARHDAGANNAAYPPMGLRVRLKASVDISGFSPQAKVILTALKKYGMILADNGSNWYITGTSDPGWNDDDLNGLKTVPGSDFEVVDTSSLVNGPDPGTATPTGLATTATLTVAPSATQVSPSATKTYTPVPPSMSSTPVPPSATASRTPAPSATATATRTAMPPSATATSAPPSATATVAVRTVILTPVADAYVRDGSYGASNFGGAKALVVKYSSSPGYNRYTYLRFDLRGVKGTVASATLRLYGRHVSASAWSGSDAVFAVADTGWAETGANGITWNTKPGMGQSALATEHTGVSSGYYTWNVGGYVATQQAGPGIASLALTMLAQHADGNLDQFNAREAGSNPPQLVLTLR